MTYKPENYPAVSPYLILSKPQAVLDFAAAVLGAEPLRIIRAEDGKIAHAECRIEDSVVMMGYMPGGKSDAHLHVYLADPDAAHARALEHGATLVQEMCEQGDGDRRGGVRGPGGVTWWLSRQV